MYFDVLINASYPQSSTFHEDDVLAEDVPECRILPRVSEQQQPLYLIAARVSARVA